MRSETSLLATRCNKDRLGHLVKCAWHHGLFGTTSAPQHDGRDALPSPDIINRIAG
jgi:hypothetical protein